MSKKLYVGGLSYGTNADSMKDLFAQYGEVTSSVVINDKMTGRSKGFGFVEMADEAAADEAINALNGQDFEGRTIIVNEARPMTDRPPRSDNRRFGAPNRQKSW